MIYEICDYCDANEKQKTLELLSSAENWVVYNATESILKLRNIKSSYFKIQVKITLKLRWNSIFLKFFAFLGKSRET